MYKKSNIMKRSHAIYNTGGYTQSEALRRSWAEVKIEKLEAEKWALECRYDFLPASVQESINQLRSEINAIRRAMNPAKEVTLVKLTEEEKEAAWDLYMEHYGTEKAQVYHDMFFKGYRVA